MFQNLRTGNVAVLGDMSDEDDRNARALGEMQKHRRDLLDLGNRAGG